MIMVMMVMVMLIMVMLIMVMLVMVMVITTQLQGEGDLPLRLLGHQHRLQDQLGCSLRRTEDTSSLCCLLKKYETHCDQLDRSLRTSTNRS